MSNPLFRWMGRSKKSKRRREKARRQRTRRRLMGESLETRKLLAGDFFHNAVDPEDVNNDGQVSALDALSVMNAMGRPDQGDGDMFTDVNNDGRRSASDALRVLNRIGRQRPGGAGPVDPPPRPDSPPNQEETEARSIDGTGNSLEDVDAGSTGTPLLRVANADYEDGISSPGGQDRPSARVISNLLSDAGDQPVTSERDLSAFVFMWGQFLDHDIDLSQTQEGDSAESFDIDVPLGDPLFDPFGTGEATIPLTRSVIDPDSGTSVDNPAQQVNDITAWIDGSQVYGSDQETADALREFIGGRLLITDDGLLPTDEEGEILAGDVRAAENIALTSMHALFVREHNRLADQISESNPGLSDEEVYQRARSRVIATLQSITFNEFLPALLGRDAVSDYRGYDSNVDPSIANEFSTAAFRFGHSTLTDTLGFVGNDGNDVADPIALADAFFQPSMLEETGIDSILKYGASTESQEIDLAIVDSLRNFLFGPPGAGGLDLASLNIQRGRDHGLADYNTTREAYGLQPYESFADLTRDEQVQADLQSLYGDINNVDLWVGLLAEDHLPDGSLGELATTIIVDQFERLRDGDRLWYENVLNGRELRQVESTTLAEVIERNTNVNSLQDNVFFFRPEISGRVTATADAAADPATETRTRRSRGGRSEPRAPENTSMEGVTVELIDDRGNVVDSAVTDSDGRYRFDSMTETGSYTVRVVSDGTVEASGEDEVEVLVRSGSTRLTGVDFQMSATV